MRFFLLPGDVACDLAKLPKQSDHRQILRAFLNTIFWGAVGTLVAVGVMA